jgi:hypothetical protein
VEEADDLAPLDQLHREADVLARVDLERPAIEVLALGVLEGQRLRVADDHHHDAAGAEHVEARLEVAELLDRRAVALAVAAADLLDRVDLVLRAEVLVDQRLERVARVERDRRVTVRAVRDQVVDGVAELVVVARLELVGLARVERVAGDVELAGAGLDVEEQRVRVGGERGLADTRRAVDEHARRQIQATPDDQLREVRMRLRWSLRRRRCDRGRARAVGCRGGRPWCGRLWRFARDRCCHADGSSWPCGRVTPLPRFERSPVPNELIRAGRCMGRRSMRGQSTPRRTRTCRDLARMRRGSAAQCPQHRERALP